MKILQFLQDQIKNPSVIGFFVACTIYFGVFMVIMKHFYIPEIKQDGQNPITMSLASINTSAPQKTHSTSVPKPKPKKPKPKKPTPKKTQPIPEEVEPEPQEEPQTQPQEDEKEQASNTTSEGAETEALAYNEGVSDEFLSKIQLAISKKNKYPRIARIRGLEGEVLIEFTLDVDGTLQGLKIIQSSAGDILNENALKAIVSASKDFPKPEQRVRIKIPIAYFLRS